MCHKIVYIIIIWSIFSCGPRTIYEEKHILDSQWSYTDDITFTYNVQDTLMAYDLILTVYHDEDFGFENLYVMTQTTFPDKKVISHPVSLQLANADGQWLGKCSNNTCQTDIYISPKSYFQSVGDYTVKIQQHSRTDSLSGILGLELRIQEAILQ